MSLDNEVVDSRRVNYEQRTAKWMSILAFSYLGIFAVEILWLSMPKELLSAVRLIGTIIWIVFVCDYVIRVALSEKRIRYIVTHPIDLIVIILPMLRPLRVLRIFTATRILIERGSYVVLGKMISFIAFAALLVVFVGSLSVLDAERLTPESNIKSFQDAIWWGVVTMTSTGYGDHYPITAEGQIGASLMMLFGVSMLGVMTAVFAAWLSDRLRAEDEQNIKKLNTQIDTMTAQLASIQLKLGIDENTESNEIKSD